MTNHRCDIAIVGCGPRGLYALDALVRAARARPALPLTVHLFDPTPHPGAGPIYAPGQPETLVMNFSADKIDAWQAEAMPRGLSFLRWINEVQRRDTAPDDYVPRGWVGDYLVACWRQVWQAAPAHLQLHRWPTRIEEVTHSDTGWRLHSGEGDIHQAQEVLLCTGHQDWNRSGLAAPDAEPPSPAAHRGAGTTARHIPSPFPIEERLDAKAVPPGSIVACRGYALSFIDAVLALTEGRGGTFTKAASGLRYAPSGQEPRAIRPYSRSGRAMRAKPEPSALPFGSPTGWESETARMRDVLATVARFDRGVWPALTDAADRLLHSAPGTCAAFFETWTSAPHVPARNLAQLRLGHRIAIGLAPPDPGRALGAVWQHFFALIVAWASHRRFDAQDEAQFARVTREMERLAFGPPARNIAKLLALIDAGLLFPATTTPPGAEIEINTTIPGPGSAALAPPLAQLWDAGLLARGTFDSIAVGPDAHVIAHDRPLPGLSVMGRATEGAVLGNDSLSRRLHDLPETWATAACARVAAHSDRPATTPQIPKDTPDHEHR